ncbi:glutathione S-transferase family protein [Nitrospirillum amazonense]|uniref:Glutathione S-transferase n=1 Tax=Nitrospirillum amazonense TaxID=28077 RepID=A0A560JXT0_9PROT|nr:glutathione S-transferase family protein [Nitrospirillum amazonense]MDG3442352.1 glutathione S-transferase family protein [Nitrospirillum amazonense]TWB73150.1 glutathione S-transferase [Nitrospirillum amazonense]
MKLYSLALSPFAARVRAALYAKDLAVDILTPPEDWRTSPAFRALNPMVRVPVLVLDDGRSIPESAVIVEYLEDAFPAVPLRPADPVDHARVRLLTAVADNYVMRETFPLFGLFDSKTPDEAAIQAQLAKLDSGIGLLNGLLAEDAARGSFAFGGRVSTADAWLVPVRYTLEGLMRFSGRTHLLDRHAAVAGYAQSLRESPALARVWDEMEDGLRQFMSQRAATA